METQHYNGGAVLVEGKDCEMGGEGAAAAGGRRTTAGLRLLAMLLTLAAAVTLELDKQTKMVTVSVGTVELSTPLTAKSAYLSAFKALQSVLDGALDFSKHVGPVSIPWASLLSLGQLSIRGKREKVEWSWAGPFASFGPDQFNSREKMFG
ncbi:hypothetical protein Droror1_Dr00002422 [Drosera rotundifolia]